VLLSCGVLRGDRVCIVGRETRNAFRIVVGKTVWKALARIMGRYGRYTEGDCVLGGSGNQDPPPPGLHKMCRRFVTISATAPCSGSAVLHTLHRRHPVSLDLLTSHTEPLNPPAIR